MKISPSWIICNRSDLQLNVLEQYQYLFEMRTKYRASPIDRFELTSTSQPTNEFIQLIKTLGRFRIPSEGIYKECYTLGCVLVLWKPLYKRVPYTRIILNPSEAGMSIHQVILWLKFIFGPVGWKSAKVYSAEQKVDLRHVSAEKMKKVIWWARPFKSVLHYQESFYLGGRTSEISVIIYDKGLQKGMNISLTRVEFQFLFASDLIEKRPTIIEFFRRFCTHNPFEELLIVKSPVEIIDRSVKRFGGRLKATFVETIKGLHSTYQRNRILQNVNFNRSFLSDIYVFRRDSWLRMR